MFQSKPLVIVLIGPTASGKTELAIEIAKYFKFNIHNIDSRQIYRFMDIGTAKPTAQELAAYPHRLIISAIPASLTPQQILSMMLMLRLWAPRWSDASKAPQIQPPPRAHSCKN